MTAAFARAAPRGHRPRHAAAQRPAARRRLDRHRAAHGRAPARPDRRRAHARPPRPTPFGHTYVWVLALTAVAAIPAFVLARSESARARARAAGRCRRRGGGLGWRPCRPPARRGRRRAARGRAGLLRRPAAPARSRRQGRRLSFAQFHLLRRLAEVDELPGEQARRRRRPQPASVTQALDHLAELGLVERVRSEADRRVVLNRLTPAGRERFEAQAGRHRGALAARRWPTSPPTSSARPPRCCGGWPRCSTRSSGRAAPPRRRRA